MKLMGTCISSVFAGVLVIALAQPSGAVGIESSQEMCERDLPRVERVIRLAEQVAGFQGPDLSPTKVRKKSRKIDDLLWKLQTTSANSFVRLHAHTARIVAQGMIGTDRQRDIAATSVRQEMAFAKDSLDLSC